MNYPKIIQGGMGVAVSGWPLARTVSMAGQLGVVSGTALAIILVRRLQLGDSDGHIRRALDHFPIPEIAQRTVDKFFVPGGKPEGQPFLLSQSPSVRSNAEAIELAVLGNFMEVFLAKEGHNGLVGINYLEKIQIPTLPSLYGAMLAGVDYVLMGAGIPQTIPGAIDALAAGKPASIRIDVSGLGPDEQVTCDFDPEAVLGRPVPIAKRPAFLAIIASATLATMLARRSTGRVDGFVVEGPCAGGHNAPPRGRMTLNERGEPVYGDRDRPELEKIQALGLPFWMAGSFAEPTRLVEAIQMGAAGVQVGTAFALCKESGLDETLKQRVLDRVRAGTADVFTDPKASPTGFPFKVLQLDGSLSDPAVYAQRQRKCDLGYLRQLYRRSDGSVGYRCPAEPVEQYLRKGGDAADIDGRICVCNGLLATAGLAQVQDKQGEKPLLTAGDDVRHILRFLKPGQRSYTAADVIQYLLGP